MKTEREFDFFISIVFSGLRIYFVYSGVMKVNKGHLVMIKGKKTFRS